MDERKALLDTIENCLVQKLEAFRQLKSLTEEQSMLLTTEEKNIEVFEELIGKKENQFVQLVALDEVITNVQSQHQNEHLLSSGLEPYQEQIDQIRVTIEVIAGLANAISDLENENKSKINHYFNSKKTNIQTFKKSKAAASKYTQNMRDTHQNYMSYFMDRKK